MYIFLDLKFFGTRYGTNKEIDFFGGLEPIKVTPAFMEVGGAFSSLAGSRRDPHHREQEHQNNKMTDSGC